MNIFSECWFKDCHHMALLPVVDELLGSYEYLLLNQIYYYEENDITGLNIKRIDFLNIYDKLELNGISCQVLYGKNVISILQENLENSAYAIIGVDNYYESIRDDYFMKQHVAHSLLITKMNYKEKIATVLEQSYFFRYDYQFYQVLFDELRNSYLGFINNMNNENFFKKELSDICKYKNTIPQISIFRKDENVKSNIIKNRREFFGFLLSYKRQMSRGVYNVLHYSKQLKNIVEKAIHDEEQREQIIKSMTEIILGKNEELVTMKRIFENGQDKKYLYNLKDIIYDWTIIRNKITKMIYNKKIQNNYFEIVEKLIHSIYVLEKDNYDFLIGMIICEDYV